MVIRDWRLIEFGAWTMGGWSPLMAMLGFRAIRRATKNEPEDDWDDFVKPFGIVLSVGFALWLMSH